MNELTDDKVIGILADYLCDCQGTLEEHHTNGCPQEHVAGLFLSQIKLQAKIEVLRETAERVSQLRDVSCMARDGMTGRQAAMERDYQYFRESPVGWLLDRADRMEDEK